MLMARKTPPERRLRSARGTSDGADGQLSLLPEDIAPLRDAEPFQDDDGRSSFDSGGVDPTRPVGPGNPPLSRNRKGLQQSPRPSAAEIERRIAEAQLWIAQRLPMIRMVENARESWGITNIQTLNRYLNTARERMVKELITDRKRHQAEQIYGLNELIRRAMEAGQFNAAVGAYRVIAEIGGLLRAPLKPPERS